MDKKTKPNYRHVKQNNFPVGCYIKLSHGTLVNDTKSKLSLSKYYVGYLPTDVQKHLNGQVKTVKSRYPYIKNIYK